MKYPPKKAVEKRCRRGPFPVHAPLSAGLLRPRQARTAFTLVELLVVIAIISIMISLIMPSISTARRFGETVGCRNNLRQMSNAFHQHAADHRGRFLLYARLWHRHTTHKDDTPRVHQLLPYIVDVDPEASPTNSGVYPSGWPFDRGNLITFGTCPTLNRTLRSDCIISSTYAMNQRAGRPITPALSGLYGGAQDSFDPDEAVRAMSQVKYPSEMFTFCDSVPTSPDNYVDGAWWYTKIMHYTRFTGGEPLHAALPSLVDFMHPYAHNDHVNIVFMDGRVTAFTKPEIEDIVLDFTGDPYETSAAGRFWRGQ